MTRPAERYRWSSYRNYVGGPKIAPWAETRTVLAGFSGDRAKYRAYVEAGKGEKQVSPFERAVAGLVLGGEEFVTRMRNLLTGRPATGDEPSLGLFARTSKALPEHVEEAVERVFAEAGMARKRRLLLYAQRLYSKLRPAEIARRYGRTPAAVTQAVRVLGGETKENRELAAGFKSLAEVLGSMSNPRRAGGK